MATKSDPNEDRMAEELEPLQVADDLERAEYVRSLNAGWAGDLEVADA